MDIETDLHQIFQDFLEESIESGCPKKVNAYIDMIDRVTTDVDTDKWREQVEKAHHIADDRIFYL